MFGFSDTAVAIVVVGIVVIVALVLGRSLQGKLGSMEVKLGSIDRSVNHREPGAETMSQDVAAIRAQMDSVVMPTLTALAERIGVLEHPEEGT